MIIISHNYNKVSTVFNENLEPLAMSYSSESSVLNVILELSKKLKKPELIVWCHKDLLKNLNIEGLNKIFHHRHILGTYTTGEKPYLSSKIGYLERSICLKYDITKTYGTYQMSAQVGGLYSDVFLEFETFFTLKKSFNYNLNSLAKSYSIEGLFCYNEPSLLKNSTIKIEEQQMPNSELFVFVKEHYKWVWSWFLLLCLLIYGKQFPLLSFLKAQFYKQKKIDVELDQTQINSNKEQIGSKHIDVVIPTIGRKTYLYDVLKDLSDQTILPKQVIIVEQNGNSNATTDLDYLKTESWPFKINHIFTHQLGVCNARNLALEQLENDWVFFADDDIRFESTLFEDSFKTIGKYGCKVLNFSCLQPNQKQSYFNTGQTYIFGSGSSFVNTELAKQINFDKTFEFGFGEDTDYGARIREVGQDVIFAAKINLIHLKAPMGGFRQPIPKLWDNEKVKPKPAPTMLALFQKHFTTNQLKGYKLFLFLKMYGKSNPLKLLINYKKFKESWNKSLFYAKQLSINC